MITPTRDQGTRCNDYPPIDERSAPSTHQVLTEITSLCSCPYTSSTVRSNASVFTNVFRRPNDGRCKFTINAPSRAPRADMSSHPLSRNNLIERIDDEV